MSTTPTDLYCIQVNHTTFEDGKQSDVFSTYITFNNFKQSFIDERWENETRSNPNYTLFGQQFTTTTVNYSDTDYSIRQFIFPDSIETAEQLHEQHKPSSNLQLTKADQLTRDPLHDNCKLSNTIERR